MVVLRNRSARTVVRGYVVSDHPYSCGLEISLPGPQSCGIKSLEFLPQKRKPNNQTQGSMQKTFVLIVAGILSTYAIKAQVANGPPTVTCPDASTVACGSLANVSAEVSDPDGDALTVVWSVNGVAIQTNDVPAGTPAAT